MQMTSSTMKIHAMLMGLFYGFFFVGWQVEAGMSSKMSMSKMSMSSMSSSSSSSSYSMNYAPGKGGGKGKGTNDLFVDNWVPWPGDHSAKGMSYSYKGGMSMSSYSYKGGMFMSSYSYKGGMSMSSSSMMSMSSMSYKGKGKGKGIYVPTMGSSSSSSKKSKMSKSSKKGKSKSSKMSSSSMMSSSGKGKGKGSIRMMGKGKGGSSGKGKGKGVIYETFPPTGKPTMIPTSIPTSIPTAAPQTRGPTRRPTTTRPTFAPTPLATQTQFRDICVPDENGVYGEQTGTLELVEFAYALETLPGTSTAIVEQTIDDLEGEIAASVVRRLAPDCANRRELQFQVQVAADVEGNEDTTAVAPFVQEVGQRNKHASVHRRLAQRLVGLSPKPDDRRLTDRGCPSVSDPANRCDMVRASLTIWTVDDGERRHQRRQLQEEISVADQVKEAIQDAMAEGEFNDSNENVVAVTWVEIDDIPPATEAPTQAPDDDDRFELLHLILVIVGSALWLCCGLMITCYLYLRRERVNPDEGNNSEQQSLKTDDRLPGSGPPSSVRVSSGDQRNLARPGSRTEQDSMYAEPPGTSYQDNVPPPRNRLGNFEVQDAEDLSENSRGSRNSRGSGNNRQVAPSRPSQISQRQNSRDSQEGRMSV